MRILSLLAVATLALSLPAVASADPTAAMSASPGAQTAPASTMEAPAAPAPAAAQPAAAPAPAQTASTNAGVNLDEIVCRDEPPATGTRLGGGRECHTVRQWNEREHEEQRMLEQQQHTGLGGVGN